MALNQPVHGSAVEKHHFRELFQSISSTPETKANNLELKMPRRNSEKNSRSAAYHKPWQVQAGFNTLNNKLLTSGPFFIHHVIACFCSSEFPIECYRVVLKNVIENYDKLWKNWVARVKICKSSAPLNFQISAKRWTYLNKHLFQYTNP